MSKLISITVCLILLFVLGCGPVQMTVSRDDNPTTYRKIFREDMPEDVEFVHSYVVNYTPRIGVITTADFEVELIVSGKWIDENCERLYLRKVEEGHFYTDILSERVKQRANEWYVPKDISNYDLYYGYMTSVPYYHMLVDKEKVGEDRYRVFYSKH